MIDFSKVTEGTTDLKQVILNQIGEEEILERYIGELNYNSPILSPLRKERNPSFTIKKTQDGKIIWRDWGTGDYGDCFNLVQKLYSCNFYEALKIIMSDFKIQEYTYSKEFIKQEKTEIQQVKKETLILIKKQPFTLADVKYWNKFGISLATLTKYNVHSAKYMWLFKEGILKFYKEYINSCPIYAYQFNSYKTKNYKIYIPFADKKHKWIFSGTKDDYEGYDQLPLLGTLLIITKSLKDVMVYHELGYSAISLQGEGNKLEQDFLNNLYKRFDNILINYDKDEQGIKSTKEITETYNLSHFFIEEGKDLSGYVELYGKQKAKKLLENLIGI